jgi:hypothetical protein
MKLGLSGVGGGEEEEEEGNGGVGGGSNKGWHMLIFGFELRLCCRPVDGGGERFAQTACSMEGIHHHAFKD